MEISTTSQKVIDQIIFWIGVGGLVLVWFSFSDLNWYRIIMGASVAAISFLIIFKRIHSRVSAFSRRISDEFGFISKVDKTGFNFHKGEDATEDKLYRWKDVQEISLKNETDLVLKFSNTTEEIISSDFVGYYKLLKNIPPDKLTNTEVKAYQTSAFANLKTCDTCGYISKKNNACLFCPIDELMKIRKQNLTLKEKQLEYFKTFEVNEKVQFSPRKDLDIVFEFDKNWKPLVTEQEVIEFSKAEYWD